ncbi:hypothetical protein F0562_003998 [Nyssa sinensis]|uniref:Uncharacterized protein n=1 Tax=Nyssa sinensis TaxID=561372 RepID=A0A5J5BXF1_9ASTE|nr:hypothetical protein F0562_003998 [Nyssa sinensis]
MVSALRGTVVGFDDIAQVFSLFNSASILILWGCNLEGKLMDLKWYCKPRDADEDIESAIFTFFAKAENGSQKSSEIVNKGYMPEETCPFVASPIIRGTILSATMQSFE